MSLILVRQSKLWVQGLFFLDSDNNYPIVIGVFLWYSFLFDVLLL